VLIQVLACPKLALNADDQRELIDDCLPCCESVGVSGKHAAIPLAGIRSTAPTQQSSDRGRERLVAQVGGSNSDDRRLHAGMNPREGAMC